MNILKVTLIVAALAVLGAGSATAASLITGKQVKDRSLKGKDIKKKTLGVNHLSVKARSALKGQAGPTGAAGPTGLAGPQGERGPSTAYAKHTTEINPITMEGTTVLSLTVPDGSYIVQGKTQLGNNAATGGTPRCEIAILRGDLFETLDEIKGLRVGPSDADDRGRSYSLLGFATASNGTNTIELRCAEDEGQNVFHNDSTLIAQQVAELK